MKQNQPSKTSVTAILSGDIVSHTFSSNFSSTPLIFQFIWSSGKRMPIELRASMWRHLYYCEARKWTTKKIPKQKKCFTAYKKEQSLQVAVATTTQIQSTSSSGGQCVSVCMPACTQQCMFTVQVRWEDLWELDIKIIRFRSIKK